MPSFFTRDISVRTCLSGCIPLDITSPKNDILVYLKWHCFCLFLSFLDGISGLLVSGFCHDLCHWHHALQIGCHLLYLIHLVGLWRLCWSFTGIYHLLAWFQMVVFWIYSYLTDTQICLSMMISYQFSDCGVLNLHQVCSYSTHLLVWGISFHFGPQCTGLISAWLSPAGSRHKYICHWFWVLWQNCCTIQPFSYS